jgi:hypothetical protein
LLRRHPAQTQDGNKEHSTTPRRRTMCMAVRMSSVSGVCVATGSQQRLVCPDGLSKPPTPRHTLLLSVREQEQRLGRRVHLETVRDGPHLCRQVFDLYSTRPQTIVTVQCSAVQCRQAPALVRIESQPQRDTIYGPRAPARQRDVAGVDARTHTTRHKQAHGHRNEAHTHTHTHYKTQAWSHRDTKSAHTHTHAHTRGTPCRDSHLQVLQRQRLMHRVLGRERALRCIHEQVREQKKLDDSAASPRAQMR